MLALSMIVFLVVLASAASNFLTGFNPDLALSFNPLNTQARVNKLSSRLAQKPDPIELTSLRNLTIRGIILDPIDARLYSLLGVIEEQQGNFEPAQQLYLHSLKLLPTEIQALTRRFAYNVNSAKYVEAVSLSDVILRRWNSQWKLIEPFMPTLLQDKAAYREALTRFSKYELGKRHLVESLSNGVASTIIAQRLVKSWHSLGVVNLRPVINKLTAKLINLDQYLSAYRLFLSTLNETEKGVAGYIFNSNFDIKPTGNVFDWRLIKQAGVTSRFTEFHMSNTNNNIKDKVFEIQFLDVPVRISRTLQHLVLPPSKFTLKLVYSTLNLKTAKPINLQIGCGNNGPALTSLSFEPGSAIKKEEEVHFKVPAKGCKFLLLRLYNGNFVESWKNRYSGSLFLHKITISLNGA